MSGYFTDRAHKVMAYANQEAQRLKHEYIGTEHILLGLVKEGEGFGATALKELGIDLSTVITNVEKATPAGQEEVTMGRLPQTPRAKRVIELAGQEAAKLGRNYIGTETLVLGLLAEHEGVAAQILMGMNLSLDKVREKVLQLIAGQDNPDNGVSITFTGGNKNSINLLEMLDLFGLKLSSEQRDKLSVKVTEPVLLDCPFSDPKFLKPSIEHAAANNPIEYLKALPRPLAKFIVTLCQSDDFLNVSVGFKSIMPEAVYKSLFPEVEGERDYRPFNKFAAALQRPSRE